IKVEGPSPAAVEIPPSLLDGLPPRRSGRHPGSINIRDPLPAQGCIEDENFGGKCKGVAIVGLVFPKKKNPYKEQPS
ncbi:hypothetical protein A2U01_0055637, partial [Trifolium medium]|nr:hypothetical protein [Trifolium medium]